MGARGGMYGRGSEESTKFDCATIGRLSSASDIDAALLDFVGRIASLGICGPEYDGFADP